LQGSPFGKGPDRNELLLRRAHFSRDVSKLATIIANYTSEFLLTTRTFHLEGEEVFGFAKCGVDFSPSANDELHRPNHINFSHPHVAILAFQPSSVDDLSVLGSPCIAQSTFPIFFQGGITASKVMCGDGI
jgi:hypothetical protein